MLINHMKDIMKISQIVKDLYVTCSEKHISLSLELDGESTNKIDFRPDLRELNINIPDLEDDKFADELIKLQKHIKTTL